MSARKAWTRKFKAPAKKRTGPYKSNWEAEYAEHLDLLQKAGEIQWWAYEPFSFRLAEGAHHRPDFIVWISNGGLEVHEVKGLLREAANLRWKVAADKYPMFRWLMVSKSKDGKWKTIKEA